MKERNYEALMSGMRKVPTITDAEELIRNQPKIKLPDRRSIALWNSPELGQFRGVSEDLDATEERSGNTRRSWSNLRSRRPLEMVM